VGAIPVGGLRSDYSLHARVVVEPAHILEIARTVGMVGIAKAATQSSESPSVILIQQHKGLFSCS
jgi:hypothetical protein